MIRHHGNIARRTPLPRRTTPIARKPAKRPEGYDNPDYRAWLKTWPCWVCLLLHCRKHLLNFPIICKYPETRDHFHHEVSAADCGETQVVHIGPNAMGLRCPDRLAMPLGLKHHIHQTAGGRWDSYHSLSRQKFFELFEINPDEVLETLHRLYREETGKEI
jgi:hypothetical protein